VRKLFVDIGKAYDSVSRDLLCHILIEFDASTKLVRLLKYV